MLVRAEGLLHRLRDGGAHIEVGDNTLRVTAPAGVLTADLQKEVVAHKAYMLDVVVEAVELLNRCGARLIKQGDRVVVGTWRDADGPEVRDALDVVGLGDVKVAHLDDPEACIPDCYRQYVHKHVSEIWARQGLLATPAERLEAERKARFLNRLFDTWGTSPRSSRIKAATVLHGMLRRKQRAGRRRWFDREQSISHQRMPYVGFWAGCVGSMSGFLEQPDIRFSCGFSRLDRICRVCRVFSVGGG